MSQENVEVAQRATDAWNRGDLEELLALHDPQVEWDFSRYEGWPDDSSLRGREAVRAFLEQWRSTFSDYRYEVDRYLDAGPRVVALCSQGGAGRESTGIAMMHWAQIVTIKDGRIVRLENYSDRREALEAAGLRE